MRSSRKTLITLALTSVVIIILTAAASVIIQNRVNTLSTEVLNSVIKIETQVTKAKAAALIYLSNPSVEIKKEAWDEVDQAELNIKSILTQSNSSVTSVLPINDLAFKLSVQRLQKTIAEYRIHISKILDDNNPSKDSSLIVWNSFHKKLNYQIVTTESELKILIRQQLSFLRLVFLGLAALSISLTLIAVSYFIHYQNKNHSYIKQVEEASQNLLIGSKKITQAEDALQESQRQLNTLINNLPGLVYKFRADSIWSMDYVSDKSIIITGYKPEQLIKDRDVSYYNLIHQDDKQKIFEQLQKAIEERKPYQLIYRIKTASGYDKWVWEQGTGIFNESNDELMALEGFITDVTEQKSFEDKLNLQSNALEATANGIIITDKDGLVVWVNSAFTKLTGFSIKEVLGKKTNFLKSGKHLPEFYSYLWNKISLGETWIGEIINKRKDGSLYTEEMTITPVKSAAGEISYYIAIKQDITERKHAEEALRESENRFRGLYENATIGLYRSSIDGDILMANPTLLKILGAERFDVLQNIKADNIYVEPERRKTFQKELELKGRIFGFESKWHRIDGLQIFVRESARAINDEDGNILYFEGTVEDITGKKKVEEEIIYAKERAEKSDRLKSEFLAQMSHEIRTPLNVILNFSSILKEELQSLVDEDLKSSFDIIDMEGKRIMRTVELILNMSELQTGNYLFHSTSVNLSKILQKLHNDFEPLASAKRILLEVNLLEKDVVLTGDEYSINQIFYHLMDNAVKYTNTGKVCVNVNKSAANHIYIDVIDTGIGIDDEYFNMLFTPFTREERGYTRNYEGNGLGLALVKRYCELNNAEIKVISQKGKGSTFRVVLPC